MTKPRWHTIFPASYKQAYFSPKAICIDWQKVRLEGKQQSSSAQLKLEWIIFYHTLGHKNARATASQFGITRKTFHKWLKRYQKKSYWLFLKHPNILGWVGKVDMSAMVRACNSVAQG